MSPPSHAALEPARSPVLAPRGTPTTRAALAYATAAVVLLLTRYGPTFPELPPAQSLFAWLAFAVALTALVPFAVLVVGLRQPLPAQGLTWGKSSRDTPVIAVALALAIAAAFVVSRSPAMQAHYPRLALVKTAPLWWIPSTLAFAAYGLAWELLFRGHLLLGVAAPLQRRALLAQTALFALAHADKPPLEQALSVPAALLFGLAALRTRSVLPGFLVHFTLSTSINLFCAYP